jgi:hypothetical protein
VTPDIRRPRRHTRLIAAALVAALAAVVAIGCGGSSGGSESADPAEIIPGSSVFYLEGTVRPEGDEKTAVNEFLERLVGENPGSLIVKALNESFPEGVTYEDDIEPWLGENAGLAVTEFRQEGGDTDDAEVAAVVSAKDADEGISKIEEATKSGGQTYSDGSYEGTDYKTEEDGTTFGKVNDFVVFASSEDTFKQVVDTSKDSNKGLAELDAYKEESDKSPDDTIGKAFVNTPAFFDALAQSSGIDAQDRQILSRLPEDLKQPIMATLSVESDKATIQTLTNVSQDGASVFGLSASVPELLAALPGDAWAALGISDIGASARRLTDHFAKLSGVSIDQLAQLAESEFGIDLQQDVFGLIGDVAVFGQGTDVSTLGGALVMQVTDDNRASQLLRHIGDLLSAQLKESGEDTQVRRTSDGFTLTSPDLPGPAVAKVGDGKAVFGYPEAVVDEAISPGSTLGSSAAYRSAASALGDGMKPQFLISFPPIITLVQAAAGQAGLGDAQTRRALQALSVAAVGTKIDGDQVTTRAVVQLK